MIGGDADAALDLVGRRLALVIWGEDRNGEEEVWVHAGIVCAMGSALFLERGGDKPMVRLFPEWLAKIQIVGENLRETLLNAEFQISLTVGPVPAGIDPSNLHFTGLTEPPG